MSTIPCPLPECDGTLTPVTGAHHNISGPQPLQRGKDEAVCSNGHRFERTAGTEKWHQLPTRP
jgi:hypothetical protein